LVSLYSTIKMMHGPINIRVTVYSERHIISYIKTQIALTSKQAVRIITSSLLNGYMLQYSNQIKRGITSSKYKLDR